MTPPPDNVRATLKIIGPIVIGAGVLLIIFGVQDERRAEERRTQQSREFMAGKRDIHDIDHGPPAGFFMIGGGMFAIVLGLGLLGFAFQKAFLRYQMRQYAPVVKEAIREVAPALASGGTRVCPRCQTDCPTDAKFCKQCGAALAPAACSHCGATNDPDSKFCSSCGRPM
jgi:hypothetical protein